MARRISLAPHLTIDEREGRYRSTTDPRWSAVAGQSWAVLGSPGQSWAVLGSPGHLLWLLARSLTATVGASLTGSCASWSGRIAQRSNQQGPTGVKDRRHQTRPSIPLVSASQQQALVAALAAGSAPEGRPLEQADGRRLEQPVARSTCRPSTWQGVRAAPGCPFAGAPARAMC